ncbi:MAG: sulfotransferase [Xanthomonadaceae bacterium]|nr:sulfotransferase [Xanthomonadaceae bacterium]
MTDDTERLIQQAEALDRQGRRAEAIEVFRQALATRPDSAEGWYELGYLLNREGSHEQALEAYDRALALGVKRPEEVRLNRAVIYSDHLRRDEDAERELKAALALDPSYVPALLNLGNLHEERGERESALVCYDLILANPRGDADPHQGLCCEALARSARLRPPVSIDDPVVLQLRHASADAVRHGHMVRANVLFALGSIYDRLGEFDLAFDAYAKANRCLLRMSGRSYDRNHASRLTDAMIETFATAAPETGDLGADPNAGATPVFICGMFRSGSTLIEQVLAGHPQVTPGGELDYLMRLAGSRLAPFPQSMAVRNTESEAALAREYRAHLARLFPMAGPGSIITDKRPDNYLLIGLIKRLFPEAKIIHTTRHPMGNGLSIFMQHLNPKVAGYSIDLGDIGHNFGEYRRLMAHWKALYPESILDFDYDAFVSDPTPALQRLVRFLGLDWDERCLEFYRLRNTVKTGSYWQVRQPLHNNASGHWRRYEAHLGPLRSALLHAGVDPEAA